MEPTAIVGGARLFHADCRDVLRSLPDNSIDSVVTDPPYALVSIVKRFGKPNSAPAKGNEAYMRASAGFMGANWDTGEVAFSEEFWAEVLRVLKPGGHVVAFSGTRTYHRMTVAIEDAGFEIRDQLGWLYGSGFPKSHDVSKAIDKAAPRRGMFDDFAKHFADRRREAGLSQKAVAIHFPSKTGGVTGCVWNWENGANVPTLAQWQILEPMLGLSGEWLPLIERVEAERTVVGAQAATLLAVAPGQDNDRSATTLDITAPATDAARQWQGWGTALKPAWEPICLARKPLMGTVAENVLLHGTGAINIDGCRVEAGDGYAENRVIQGGKAGGGFDVGSSDGTLHTEFAPSSLGRWPANIVHDGSDEVLAAFPDAPGQQRAVGPEHGEKESRGIYGDFGAREHFAPRVELNKSAARFFYCAKASRKDRDEGLETAAKATTSDGRAVAADNAYQRGKTLRANTHPTVKPTSLMQWLCRLVTPPGGTILDPFMGSGSTGKAALLEGFNFIGCEREDEYMPIAQARIAAALRPVAAQVQPGAVPANDNQPQADLFAGAA